MRFLVVLLCAAGALSHPHRFVDPLPPPGPIDQIRAEAIENSEIAELLQKVNPKKYLETFGYLKGDADSEKQADAIKLYQEKSDIEQTGKMNLDTLRQMIKPRCGLEDVLPDDNIVYSEFFTKENGTLNASVADPFKLAGRRHTWDTKKPLKWKIEGWTRDLSQRQVESTMRNAFKTWADESGLRFQKAKRKERPELRIDFERGAHPQDRSPFDGKGGTLAHAFYPRDGRIHFDDDETWSLDKNKKGAINLEWVAIHEFGHALGLAHSKNKNAVMYPFYPGFVGRIKLHRDDKLGIRSMYGADKLTAADGEKAIFPDGISFDDCPLKIDAAFQDKDGHPVLLSGEKLYRYSENGLKSPNPSTLHDDFFNWPTHVDAAFYAKSGKHYVFSKYYVAIYSPDSPKSTNVYNYKIGLPSDVDGAFQYSRNDKIYVFKTDQYWRVSEDTLKVDDGYPRLIKDGFDGIDVDIDAAITYKENAYFFSGHQYYKFNPDTNQVDAEYPSDIANDWFNCNKADNIVASNDP